MRRAGQYMNYNNCDTMEPYPTWSDLLFPPMSCVRSRYSTMRVRGEKIRIMIKVRSSQLHDLTASRPHRVLCVLGNYIRKSLRKNGMRPQL